MSEDAWGIEYPLHTLDPPGESKEKGVNAEVQQGACLRQAGPGEAAREHVAQLGELAGLAVGRQHRQRLAPLVQRPGLHQPCAGNAL